MKPFNMKKLTRQEKRGEKSRKRRKRYLYLKNTGQLEICKSISPKKETKVVVNVKSQVNNMNKILLKGYLTYLMAVLAIAYAVFGVITGWIDNATGVKIAWIGLTTLGIRRAIK